ncbi:MAG: class E sortase [Actinomycetota bacterium]|jgi:hypothetical protein
MTATTTSLGARFNALRRGAQRDGDRAPRTRTPRPEREKPTEIPPLSPGLNTARTVLVVLFVLSLSLLLQFSVVSGLQHSAAQGRVFDLFREQLAAGTAPIGPTDIDGVDLEIGAPVAFLEIPSIDLREVVVEGTTSRALLDGPGHRRDTPLPGQIGTSIVFGRRAAYGGPFSRINELTPGTLVRVTTAQGTFDYSVIGVRADGDPLPAAPAANVGRLMLVTAAGRAYLPDGVIRVDAELLQGAVGGPPRFATAATLPDDEQALRGDPSTLWALVLWLQLLILLALAAVWSWHRWGRAQAWLVFLPPLLLVGLAVAGEIARLLPNLL